MLKSRVALASLALVAGCIGVNPATKRASHYINGTLVAGGVVGIAMTANINGHDPIVDSEVGTIASVSTLVLGLSGFAATLFIEWFRDDVLAPTSL